MVITISIGLKFEIKTGNPNIKEILKRKVMKKFLFMNTEI